MSDLFYAKVDDTDNGDQLLKAIDDAQDELDLEIRRGPEYRSTAPGDVSRARKEILDRVYSLCEALREVRSALDEQIDRAEHFQQTVEEQEAELQSRYSRIVELQDANDQLRAQLAEVAHA
jgi:septal ring factor EnvC (AmiA/AmiB activator)